MGLGRPDRRSTSTSSECLNAEWLCPGAPNSTGAAAELTYFGSLRMQGRDLTLVGTHMPADTFGGGPAGFNYSNAFGATFCN